jgi:hypothetical protein
MPLLGRGDSGFESLHPDSMEKFPGEVEILNKELEQKFPNLEAEAYKQKKYLPRKTLLVLVKRRMCISIQMKILDCALNMFTT